MSKLMDLFNGKKDSSPPIWFMRQAGRYLPEYRQVRNTFKTFLDFCYTPEKVVEVTLQPLHRFDFDAAIIFSDILVIPDALGQKVSFQEGKGPVLSSLSLCSFQKELSLDRFLTRLAPVYEAIQGTRETLSLSKALIGFSGTPWTLALYMLEGEGSRDFAKAKKQAFEQEDCFLHLLSFLTQAVSTHLIEQIKAGVDVIQLFDTWAGLCPASHFDKWILKPTQQIIRCVKDYAPHLPILGFPKGVGPHVVTYGQLSGVSGVSLDSSIPLSWASQTLPTQLILQGNLDPLALVAGGDSLKRECEVIHAQMGDRPYIFNLGHGILPQTPIPHVEECIKWVRSFL